MSSTVQMLGLHLIRTNPAALREVNRASEKFLQLVASVRLKGILNAISVRELEDPITHAKYYGLIDGLHRFTAATDAGLSEIPAVITSMSDGEVEEAQIIANIQRIETKPIEYTEGLLRMLTRNPTMTEAELAQKLCQSVSWLKERLNLLKLTPEIQTSVNEGKIGLANAYTLAKLPPEEQPNFADRAATLPPAQFLPAVNGRVKELRDAARQGREAAAETFTPVAHLRKVKELVGEADSPAAILAEANKAGVTDVKSALVFALKWAVNLDPTSIEIQRAEDEKRRLKRAEDQAKSKKEREEKAAAKKAAALSSLDGSTPVAGVVSAEAVVAATT